MIRKITVFFTALLFCCAFLKPAQVIAYDQDSPDRIQVAILLDTSGSMEGLIEQTKSYLYRIINELSGARKYGRSPVLEVALFEYGKSTIPASEGYLRQLVPLTRDIDWLSQELFRLRTQGGLEYCGMVIDAAVKTLRWSKKDTDLKMIFIAGNEPFSQGPVDYRIACRDAFKAGIIVNTIHCGDYQEGIRDLWKDGAYLGGGQYTNIDHNVTIRHYSSPYDDDIVRYGTMLNHTYIPYGQHGGSMKQRQFEQDQNAMQIAPEVMADRSVSKSISTLYSNDSWDLVDAQKAGADLSAISKQDLPSEMQSMSRAEQARYIDQKRKEREQIQSEIKKLNLQRDAFIAEQQKIGTSDQDNLFGALVTIIREQARQKGFDF